MFILESISSRTMNLSLWFLFWPPGRCHPSTMALKVSMGLRVLLPCVQLSPRPCSWAYPPHRHTRQHNSDLEVTVTEDSLGKYVCTCQVCTNKKLHISNILIFNFKHNFFFLHHRLFLTSFLLCVWPLCYRRADRMWETPPPAAEQPIFWYSRNPASEDGPERKKAATF